VLPQTLRPQHDLTVSRLPDLPQEKVSDIFGIIESSFFYSVAGM